jgi:outer membrane receptor protein involved in Fe transport
MNRSVAFSTVLLATTMLSPTLAAAQDAAEPAPASTQAETIVVRGQFIPNPQRATSQVATFLESADLERAGDATAAIALTRLSGLSIVSDRFAYVRGLGERYSLALLNGSPLPSPEPLRRTVPLDLFPTDLLDGIAVQKTFSANYPGDFGGGVIELNTLREARENYAALSGGFSYNSINVEEDGIYVRGSDTDWTGYDDGLRKVPAALKDVLASGDNLNDFDSATVERVGESLVNSPLSVIQRSDLEPDFNVSAELGRRFDTDQFSLGLVGAVGYDRGWTTAIKTRQSQQGGIAGIDLTTTETTMNADVHALGSAALLFGDHTFQSTLFYTHATSSEAQIDEGVNFNRPGDNRVWDESSGWYERQLGMLQFSGGHLFGPFSLDWRVAGAESSRNAPYERALERQPNADNVPAYLVANSYRLRFSELTDTSVSGGADLSYEFEFGERSGKLSVGVDEQRTARDYDYLSLFFAGGNSLPEDVQIARPDFLFSPDNIDPNRFVLRESASTNDSHSATLEVSSAYGQADLEVIPYVRTTLGVRYEDAEEQVRVFDRFGNPGPDPVLLRSQYWLPSGLVTWNFYEDMQLRFGYSETIARPQFRELARSLFLDPESERTYRGNSDLVDSEFTNYDLRYEYYMGRDASLTLGGFYKEVENPIEESLFSTTTFGFDTTFINAPHATLSGGEFEFRRYFQLPIESSSWLSERDWLLAFNYTYTKSEVEAKPGDTIADPITGLPTDASLFIVDGSPMQGSPENIVNLQTGWRSPTDELTLLLGWVDERILQRGIPGPAGRPDVIEDPGIQLDLSFRRYFEIRGAELTLGITGRNLLDEKHVEYQRSDNLVTDFNTYDRGRTLSVSLSSRF